MTPAIGKQTSGSVAVDRIDLAVVPREFLELMGPGGSRKTTTLMMIAVERSWRYPQAGDVFSRLFPSKAAALAARSEWLPSSMFRVIPLLLSTKTPMVRGTRTCPKETIARTLRECQREHTHPGIESTYVIEGGLEVPIQG
jgi:hypothetical protein